MGAKFWSDGNVSRESNGNARARRKDLDRRKDRHRAEREAAIAAEARVAADVARGAVRMSER